VFIFLNPPPRRSHVSHSAEMMRTTLVSDRCPRRRRSRKSTRISFPDAGLRARGGGAGQTGAGALSRSSRRRRWSPSSRPHATAGSPRASSAEDASRTPSAPQSLSLRRRRCRPSGRGCHCARSPGSNRNSAGVRSTGDGPPFVRIGPRLIAYRLCDVETWLASRTFPHRAAELGGRRARARRPRHP
jgi:hypothetical protein